MVLISKVLWARGIVSEYIPACFSLKLEMVARPVAGGTLGLYKGTSCAGQSATGGIYCLFPYLSSLRRGMA